MVGITRRHCTIRFVFAKPCGSSTFDDVPLPLGSGRAAAPEHASSQHHAVGLPARLDGREVLLGIVGIERVEDRMRAVRRRKQQSDRAGRDTPGILREVACRAASTVGPLRPGRYSPVRSTKPSGGKVVANPLGLTCGKLFGRCLGVRTRFRRGRALSPPFPPRASKPRPSQARTCRLRADHFSSSSVPPGAVTYAPPATAAQRHDLRACTCSSAR